MNEKKVVEYSGEITFFPMRENPIVARFECVYGHPQFSNGDPVISSQIVSIAEDGTIETLNTIYKPSAK